MDSAISCAARVEQINELGGTALLSALVKQFGQAYTKDIAQAARAVDELDYETLGKLAHRIEGACAIFGAAPALEACHALRTSVKQGTPDELRLRLTNLETELLHLQRALALRLEQQVNDERCLP